MANAKPSKKKADTPGVMDVSKPGKGTPSATSRPIIVTNRPILQDPMVAGDTGATTEEKPPVAAKPSQKVTVQPISIKVQHDGEETDANAKEPEAPAGPQPEMVVKPLEEPLKKVKDEAAKEPTTPLEDAAPEDVPAPAEEVAETKDETPEEKPEPDTKTDEAQADGAANEEKKTALTPEEQEAAAKKAEEEAAAHAAAIQKLADSHEYYLPIKTTESRKTRRFIMLGAVLILVLGVAWVDVALDAGLLHISGVKPVTHFFTN